MENMIKKKLILLLTSSVIISGMIMGLFLMNLQREQSSKTDNDPNNSENLDDAVNNTNEEWKLVWSDELNTDSIRVEKLLKKLNL